MKEVTSEEARPLIESAHYAPMPREVIVCYGAYRGQKLIAAAVFNRFDNKDNLEVFEFVSYARDPAEQFQGSSLVSYCCKQLKSRTKLLVTFCERDKGDGTIFKGSSWNYDGERKRSTTGYRLDGERGQGYHIYWKALQRGAEAQQLGLTCRPYNPRSRYETSP